MVDQYELVSMLREIASYERGFKQQAFINAADAITALTQNRFEEYISLGDYTLLYGVGKSVGQCIKEYVETGNMTRLENHRNSSEVRNPLI